MSSKNIDENVVQMKFDNAQFESNVKTTMNTLDRLKQALHFSNAGDGLENLSKSCSSLSSNGFGLVGSAVETVQSKFSALEVIGITALANITNSAVNAGKKIVSAMTIDGAKDGFTEYELKMNSTRTIMASTGESLDVVNQKLEELNKYSDQTIYSFSDMTQNIGKFTNAGVSLDESVNAIKGISNAAALAGANSNEASRAMYNFAQALSAGHVKLIDWKSIENANMATQEFKQQLIDTAVEMGTLKDYGDGTYGILNKMSNSGPTWTSTTQNFNESLAQQWMTTDVLVKTLNKYADSTTDIGKKAYEAAMEVTTFSKMMDALKEAIGSGWSKSFELVFGDLEEAKKLWTSINIVLSGVIEDSANARNKAIQYWKDTNGLDTLKGSIASMYRSVRKITDAISKAFSEVFPRANLATMLRSLSDGFFKMASAVGKATKHLTEIKAIATGFFSAIKIGLTVVKTAITIIGNFISSVYNAFGGTQSLLDIGVAVANKITEFSKTLTKSNIDNFIDKANDKIAKFAETLKAFVTDAKGTLSGLKDAFVKNLPDDNIFSKALSGLENFAAGVKTALSKITSSFKSEGIGAVFTKFVEIFSKACGSLKTMLASLMDAISPVIDKIKSLFEGMTITGGITKLINAGGLAVLVGVIGNTVENLGDLFSKIKIIGDGVVSTVVDLLQGLADALEAWEQEERLAAVRNLAISVGILAAAIVALSAIDPTDAAHAVGLIAALLGELIGAIKVIDVILNNKRFSKPTEAIGGIKGFIEGLKSLGGELHSLIRLTIIGSLMKTVATSLLIGAGALVLLATIPEDRINDALKAFAAILIGLTSVVSILTYVQKKADGVDVRMAPILGLAAALVVAASALKILSTINADAMKVAVGGMTAVLFEMTGAIVVLDKFTKYQPSSATAMIQMSAALAIASVSLKILASIPWTSLVKAIIGMTAVIGEMALTLIALDKFTKYQPASATAMIQMAAALVIASASLKILASIPWTSLVKALGAMFVVLGAMAGAIVVIDKFTKFSPAGAGSMIAMAAALVIASESLKMLASIPWKSLAKSVVAMAVVLAGLAAACIFLGEPMALVGAAAMLVISAGLIALAGALKIMASISLGDMVKAILGLAGALIIFGAIGAGLGIVAPLLISAAAAIALFGAGALAAGAGIALFAVGIATLAQVSKESAHAIIETIQTILEGLITLIPTVADAFVQGIAALAESVVKYWPTIKEAVATLLDGLIDLIVEFVPKIVEAAITLIISLVDALAEHAGELVSAGAKLLTSFVQGIADAVEEYLPTLTESFKTIFGGIYDSIVDIFSDVFSSIGEGIGKVLGSIVDGFAEGLADGLKDIGTALSDFMDAASPFFDKLGEIDPSVISSAKVVAETCLIFAAAEFVDGVSKFISVFTGGSSIADFGKELAEFGTYLTEFSNNTKGVDAAHVSQVALAAKALTKFAESIPNEGGLVAKITGDNNLSNFAEAMIDFAYGLTEFSEEASKITDTKSIEIAAEAGKILIDFAKRIPNEGGLVASITGDNSLSRFAEELVPFADCLNQFTNKVDGITDSDVTSASLAADIGLLLAKFANEIPNAGGLVAQVTGENSLTEFAEEMTKFGDELNDFRNNISSLEDGDVAKANTAAEIGRVLVKFAEDISKSKGIAKIIKDGTIENLCNVMKPFAVAINDFVEQISGIGSLETDIASAIDLIKVFNDPAIQNAGSNYKNLKYFGTGVEEIGKALKKFVDDMNVGGVSEMAKHTRNYLMVFIDKAKEMHPDFYNSGKQCITQFINGFKSVNIKPDVDKVVNSVVSTLKSKSNYDKCYNAGKNLVQGFADGISKNTKIASDAADKMAQSSINATTKKLNEHSPSRVFYGIGEYAVLGFANALNDGQKIVSTSSENMGDTAIDGLSSTLSRVSDYIQNGLDDEHLTITPVLDLSNINTGLGTINSMFAHEQAMSISSNGFNGNSANGATLNQILTAIREFSGFNVVMDTGATVGALAPTMNNALGMISYREARR